MCCSRDCRLEPKSWRSPQRARQSTSRRVSSVMPASRRPSWMNTTLSTTSSISGSTLVLATSLTAASTCHLCSCAWVTSHLIATRPSRVRVPCSYEIWTAIASRNRQISGSGTTRATRFGVFGRVLHEVKGSLPAESVMATI